MDKPKNLHHPKHWWVFITKGILWGSSQLPHRFLLMLGKSIGFIISCFKTKNNRVILRNLELCFPHLSVTERHQLARRCWQSHAMAVFETAKGWWGNRKKLQKIYQIEGEQYLNAALASDQGVMLITGHFTCSELGSAAFSLLADYSATAKHLRHPIADFEIYKARRRNATNLFFAEDMKEVYQALRKGEIVGFLLDQDYGDQRTVFAPFFDIPAATTTAVGRIAAATGSIVIPSFFVRLPGKLGYRMIFKPPLVNFPSADPVKDATLFNQVIENMARAYPDQYGWEHINVLKHALTMMIRTYMIN